MKLTEQLEEIALRVATTDPDCISKLISPEQAKVFAAAFLAALPKPDPVGHYIGEHKDGSDCVYLYSDIKKNQMLYTTPPQPDDVRDAWQPIETAPKDGTKILAYTNDGYRFPLVSQCVWDDGWWPDVWESPEVPLNPTHWMPLPEAPAIAAAKGEV